MSHYDKVIRSDDIHLLSLLPVGDLIADDTAGAGKTWGYRPV